MEIPGLYIRLVVVINGCPEPSTEDWDNVCSIARGLSMVHSFTFVDLELGRLEAACTHLVRKKGVANRVFKSVLQDLAAIVRCELTRQAWNILE